jgi:hypothetical protein
VLHFESAHVRHAVSSDFAMHTPPSSLDEPPEPPVPEPPPPAVVVLEPAEPPEPCVVEVVPPSLVPSVTSVVHAPRIAITADAAAHLVMFFIVPLLTIGYAKLVSPRRSGAGRAMPSCSAALRSSSISCFVRTSQIADPVGDLASQGILSSTTGN